MILLTYSNETKQEVLIVFDLTLLPQIKLMKKIHIILLVLIAGAIAVLTSFLKITASYETIAGARSKAGKFVHVAAKLDTTSILEYDELKDPNYLSFTAIDSLGDKMKVVYRDGRIPNLEISEKIVLEGKYKDNYFECDRVQTKCPSKYKDDMKAAEKNIQNAASKSSTNY